MPNRNRRTERVQTQQAAKPSWLENVVTPWWMRVSLPLATWRKKASDEKKIYLTFDDGPSDQMTDRILAILNRFDARATFFCIGQHAELHQSRLADIVAQGHLVGNHSYSHLNGWETDSNSYVDDVRQGQKVLSEALGHSPRYFRPPYGRISLAQLLRLRKMFEVVMWDILSMDYRHELTGEEVGNNVTQHARPGSIVLLHDSELAAPRVQIALPRILQHFSDKGFQFCTLDH
jgi:peptidoglycan/xylan/chitin deacetylase (PgdA/CDA1 family)